MRRWGWGERRSKREKKRSEERWNISASSKLQLQVRNSGRRVQVSYPLLLLFSSSYLNYRVWISRVLHHRVRVKVAESDTYFVPVQMSCRTDTSTWQILWSLPTKGAMYRYWYKSKCVVRHFQKSGHRDCVWTLGTGIGMRNYYFYDIKSNN